MPSHAMNLIAKIANWFPYTPLVVAFLVVVGWVRVDESNTRNFLIFCTLFCGIPFVCFLYCLSRAVRKKVRLEGSVELISHEEVERRLDEAIGSSHGRMPWPRPVPPHVFSSPITVPQESAVVAPSPTPTPAPILAPTPPPVPIGDELPRNAFRPGPGWKEVHPGYPGLYFADVPEWDAPFFTDEDKEQEVWDEI